MAAILSTKLTASGQTIAELARSTAEAVGVSAAEAAGAAAVAVDVKVQSDAALVVSSPDTLKSSQDAINIVWVTNCTTKSINSLESHSPADNKTAIFEPFNDSNPLKKGDGRYIIEGQNTTRSNQVAFVLLTQLSVRCAKEFQFTFNIRTSKDKATVSALRKALVELLPKHLFIGFIKISSDKSSHSFCLILHGDPFNNIQNQVAYKAILQCVETVLNIKFPKLVFEVCQVMAELNSEQPLLDMINTYNPLKPEERYKLLNIRGYYSFAEFIVARVKRLQNDHYMNPALVYNVAKALEARGTNSGFFDQASRQLFLLMINERILNYQDFLRQIKRKDSDNLQFFYNEKVKIQKMARSHQFETQAMQLDYSKKYEKDGLLSKALELAFAAESYTDAGRIWYGLEKNLRSKPKPTITNDVDDARISKRSKRRKITTLELKLEADLFAARKTRPIVNPGTDNLGSSIAAFVSIVCAIINEPTFLEGYRRAQKEEIEFSTDFKLSLPELPEDETFNWGEARVVLHGYHHHLTNLNGQILSRPPLSKSTGTADIRSVGTVASAAGAGQGVEKLPERGKFLKKS